MKKSSETDELTCDFCKVRFSIPSAFMKHMCEPKRRWNDKDTPINRIAFQCWLLFVQTTTPTKKQKSYEDFMKSPYYLSFVRFSRYCTEIKCVNILSYAKWLFHHTIKIDTWCKDTEYNKFLVDYLKNEDPFDALSRSVKATMEISEHAGIVVNDCFRYGNKNRIIQAIISGKISPWMIYQSKSGINFIESLDVNQQTMIIEYIDPEQWSNRFQKYANEAEQIKNILSESGY